MINIFILILFDVIIGMWAFPIANISAVISVAVVNILFLWSAFGVPCLIKGIDNSYAKSTRVISSVFSIISIIIAIVFILLEPANIRFAILTYLIFLGIYIFCLIKFIKASQKAG